MTRQVKRRRRAVSLFQILTSMNFAIALLVVICIASAIGTILQQNKLFIDYANKFGPFWTDFFDFMGLLDLYGAAWFMMIMAALLVSTSSCLIRQSPGMLKEVRRWRMTMRKDSMRGFRQYRHFDYSSDSSIATTLNTVQKVLHSAGYRSRVKGDEQQVLIAAKQGSLNRVGYMATHLAIVLICIGGLMDSGTFVSVATRLGFFVPETRNLVMSEVSEQAFLPAWNPSYRATLNLPEGSASGAAYQNAADGYFVQPLPFSIELIDFRIQHYASGPPKSFDSQLKITDPSANPTSFEQVISVNKPLKYRGVTIYQSSFEDGGSSLEIEAIPFRSEGATPISTRVGLDVQWAEGAKFEFNDFRLFNINPVVDAEGEVQQRNFGPMVVYKLRQADGSAREYENYMYPVDIDGVPVLLSGMRKSVREQLKHLRIPVDNKNSAELFFELYRTLADPVAMAEILKTLPQQLRNNDSIVQQEALRSSMLTLSQLIADKGLDGLVSQVDSSLSTDQKDRMFQTLSALAFDMFVALYDAVAGPDRLPEGVDEAKWLETAFFAASGVSQYGSDVYLSLSAFNHLQASGLQIVKSPGTFWVYLGCALLSLGVFAMFYSHQRRIWVILSAADAKLEVFIAGSDARRSPEFEQQFEAVSNVLQNNLIQKS